MADQGRIEAPSIQEFTRASSSLSTTPPPTCPPASSPSVTASPPPPPTVPAQPPAPAPAPQPAQPPLFQQPAQPPLFQPVRDEFYPYGEGRIVAQQQRYPVLHYQPPYWPPPSPYHSYPGPALPPHSLHSVTPAFAWPSHLPSYGQQLRGGGRQDDPRFQLGPQQPSQSSYGSLHRPQ